MKTIISTSSTSINDVTFISPELACLCAPEVKDITSPSSHESSWVARAGSIDVGCDRVVPGTQLGAKG
jgi:hypothetical protein